MRDCAVCQSGAEVQGEGKWVMCAWCGRQLHTQCAIHLGLNLEQGSAEQLWGGGETASPDADVACVECACGWYPPCCVARYAACAWCLLFLVSSTSFSLLRDCHCSGICGTEAAG